MEGESGARDARLRRVGGGRRLLRGARGRASSRVRGRACTWARPGSPVRGLLRAPRPALGVPSKAHGPACPRCRLRGSAPVRDPGGDACRSGTAPGPCPPHHPPPLAPALPGFPACADGGWHDWECLGQGHAGGTREVPGSGAGDSQKDSVGGWGGPARLVVPF